MINQRKNTKKQIRTATCLLILMYSMNLFAQNTEASGKLVVWSYTDEIETMLKEYYLPVHPEVELDYSFIPIDQYSNRLDDAFVTGRSVPDIIILETSFARKYIESGLLFDLTSLATDIKNNTIPYTIEYGTYNDKVYGLSWLAVPGVMFYRRSLAQKYLGTDDSVEVQSFFNSFEKLIETANSLKEKSNDSCVLVPSSEDLFLVFKGARKKPWVVNDTLVIDEAMISYMEMAKTFFEKNLEAKVTQWSEAWFNGMKGTLHDNNWNSKEVFSYFFPSWGLDYVLKTNAPETSGDWAMIPGPAPWFWGGTWVGVSKNTPNPIAAQDFIRYITSNEEFLASWAKDTGDLVSNNSVIQKIQDSFNEPYLNGQNHYSEFAKNAQEINGKTSQGTDALIESFFLECTEQYVQGFQTLSEALYNFMFKVESETGIRSK